MLSFNRTLAEMAKRGRKPKERKGYFYENEEKAIVDYINETNIVEKNKIFNTILYPALTKMIESIIRRYKLFVPDEEFEQNFSDTISYLLTKINHFKPEIYCYDEYSGSTENIEFVEMAESEFRDKVKGADEMDPEYIHVDFEDDEENSENKNNFKKVFHKYKAYSYCGTVCRNYLVYKCAQYAKKKLRNSSYEDVYDDINNDERFSTDDDNFSSHAEALVSKIIHEIESMINKKVENGLTENEVKVGKSLITLFRDWERVLPNEGSKKLQKSSILYYLREDTLMTTKELRDNMRRYKLVYYLLKENEIK